MRITVKSIIKWGLLAEIMTAIVGQVGEFTLRYRAYSYAFDELFGSYYPLPEAHFNNLPGNYSNETASSNWTDSTSSSELDQHYDHRLGRSYRRPATGSLPLSSSPPPAIFPHQNSSVESQSRTTPASFLHSVWHNIFSGSNKPISAEQFWNESSFGPSPAHRSLDPRPILVCVTLVLLNLFFIGGILYECLALICSLTVAWLLYLILVLLILHAGTRSSSVQGQASISSSSTSASTFGHFGNQYRHSDGVHVWVTLVPSPFTILVISIILVFSLVLIAMIVEERRQIAYRIRAKSAAIPLVKSRDMDLDEI